MSQTVHLHIDRTDDRLINLEQARAVRELSEIQQHLTAFEQKYRLASDEFYLSYEAGQLEDSADFMEWSSFYDMRRSAQQYLDEQVEHYDRNRTAHRR